jgi:hypothetical protein
MTGVPDEDLNDNWHTAGWTSVGRAYAIARFSDIRNEAAKALRSGSSEATMEALVTIARIATLEIERQGTIDDTR